MPTTISCPSCKRPLRIPDELLGKGVKCPTCQTVFTAPGQSPPAPPPPPVPAPDPFAVSPPQPDPFSNPEPFAPPGPAAPPPWEPYGPEGPSKHSEAGIIACVLAALAFLLIAAYFGIAGFAGFQQAQADQQRPPGPLGSRRTDSPLLVVAGLMGIAGFGVAVIGTILGSVGVCMSNRKKLFAWIGLAGNGTIVLGCLGLFCIGMFAAVALLGGGIR